MRELFYIFALLFAVSTLFLSCGNDDIPTVTIPVESVTITPSEYSIVVDTPAVPFIATVLPANATNRAVVWTSENDNIARVNAQGAVTAVSEGTTTIIVTTEDGSFTAASAVTVTLTVIYVESVTITGCADVPLAIGATHQLTATVLPKNATNRAVAWTSSNRNIATVNNNGLVTAVAVGTATITVTTADGDKTATSEITVACNIDNSAGVVIDGIRWATRNVDMPGTFAPHPESAGRLFQWGTLNGVTHHWAATGAVTNWNSNSNRVAWTPDNDPCPPGWRVPTSTELTNFRNQPNEWTQRNGVNGRIFGTAPDQLFLPAAGFRLTTNGVLSSGGASGLYWSSTESGTGNAMRLNIGSTNSSVSANNRAFGISVRCVAD